VTYRIKNYPQQCIGALRNDSVHKVTDVIFESRPIWSS